MMFDFLKREKSIAPAGYNRWLIPPAALAIHLSIGQIYAYSVFNKPLTQILGVTTTTADDWSLATIGWVFSIAIAMLGASAAIFGKWLEKEGPRKAMFYSTLLFSSGFFVSAVGIYYHNLWLFFLGNGVLGGIGLGIGYISPISTLMKWFPDYPGMATGLAIMGFGGGAMLASPLSVLLLDYFATHHHNSIIPTFIVLGIGYLFFMMFGVLTIKVPNEHKSHAKSNKASPHRDDQSFIGVSQAVRTHQFWLLFVILCLNITAGIGVLGQASVMIQELFATHNAGVSAEVAAGFVGFLSLFNMLGRFFWSSISDYIGRKNTYSLFFLLGVVLYSIVPCFGAQGNLLLFVLGFGIIMSMYGGGFATIPAYLRDLFGVQEVGSIHGRLLIAWSLAAIIGPVLVNYIRQAQLANGVEPVAVYSFIMYLMASLLALGLLVNLLVTENTKHSHHHAITLQVESPALVDNPHNPQYLRLILSYLLVGLPLAYGMLMVIIRLLQLW